MNGSNEVDQYAAGSHGSKFQNTLNRNGIHTLRYQRQETTHQRSIGSRVGSVIQATEVRSFGQHLPSMEADCRNHNNQSDNQMPAFESQRQTNQQQQGPNHVELFFDRK